MKNSHAVHECYMSAQDFRDKPFITKNTTVFLASISVEAFIVTNDVYCSLRNDLRTKWFL